MAKKKKKPESKPDPDQLMRQLWRAVEASGGNLEQALEEFPQEYVQQIDRLFVDRQIEIPAVVMNIREAREVIDDGYLADDHPLTTAVRNALSETSHEARLAYHEREMLRHGQTFDALKKQAK